MPNNFPFPIFGVFTYFVAMAYFILNLLMHLFLAQGVYREARSREVTGRKVWFAGPGFWAFATLFTGILPTAVYWAMHHSTLASVETIDPDNM